jgi:hypothetical protein
LLAGRRTLRFTGDDLERRPVQAVAEVRAALGRRCAQRQA